MYYFKKPIALFTVRLIFEVVAFALAAGLALDLYNLSSQASSDDAVNSLLVLGSTTVAIALFFGWQLYRLVADFVQQPVELVGFVVAKELIFKKNVRGQLGQVVWQSDIKGCTLRLLPPEWVQEYYDEAHGLIAPVPRNRKVLLWRDRQTLFRVPTEVFNMVLEQDLVRIMYAKRHRTVYGLEVVASITPPAEVVAQPIADPTRLLPDTAVTYAESVQWREIED